MPVSVHQCKLECILLLLTGLYSTICTYNSQLCLLSGLKISAIVYPAMGSNWNKAHDHPAKACLCAAGLKRWTGVGDSALTCQRADNQVARAVRVMACHRLCSLVSIPDVQTDVDRSQLC